MKILRCAVLLGFCSSPLAILTTRGAILQAVTETLAQANGIGVSANAVAARKNQPALTEKPVRGGKFAFTHSINEVGDGCEISTMPTATGSTYWYGWSLQLPSDFDHRDQQPTFVQLASPTSRHASQVPCNGVGSFLRCDDGGRLVFHLQHAGDDGVDSKCDEFVILEDVSKTKDQWIDFVMHAKWTGDKDGFVELWAKAHDNNFFQRVAYAGRTWWNDEDAGPVFSLGVSAGRGSHNAAAGLTVYTDELRLGDAASGFDEVAPPGANERAGEAGRGHVRYVVYPSTLNKTQIPIMVYTPPGYVPGAEKRYPVVYNLHGAGGGSPERQWARIQKTLTQAMDSGAVPPMITIFVNGLGDTGYLDYPGPSTPKVFSSIVTELIPYIDANYRTIADRKGRAIDGFSMGGGGAMMIALKRPDLFSSVVSYGGAFIKGPPNGFPDPKDARPREILEQFGQWALVRRNLEAIRAGLQVRMVCGDQDSLYPLNKEFLEFLGTVDIPVSWVSVPGVAHETKRLYDRVGVESLEFMQRGFARP